MRRVLLLAIVACHHGASGPPTATCAAVSDHVLSMLGPDDHDKTAPDEHAKSVRDAFAARCAKDDWSSEARGCILDTKTLHDGHHCKDRLTPEQRSALDLDLATIEKNRAAALPVECERYRLAIIKLAACDKMPLASREAMKQGYDTMAHGWESVATLPADAKRAMASGCQQGFEAIQQTGKQICGW